MLSAPIVITPPEGDLVDLDALKLFLKVDTDDQDGEIAGYAAAVVADIERMTSTRILEQTVELRGDGFADLNHLPIGPVNDVIEIRYVDQAGTVVTIDPEVYELRAAGLEASIRPAFGRRWPVAREISIELNVGYGADVPPSIALAISEGVRARFDGTSFDLFAATVNDRIWG